MEAEASGAEKEFEIISLEEYVPVFIFDFLYCIEEEEYELCANLRDELYKVYGELEGEEKTAFSCYIKDYLNEYDHQDNEALKGVFKDIV